VLILRSPLLSLPCRTHRIKALCNMTYRVQTCKNIFVATARHAPPGAMCCLLLAHWLSGYWLTPGPGAGCAAAVCAACSWLTPGTGCSVCCLLSAYSWGCVLTLCTTPVPMFFILRAVSATCSLLSASPPLGLAYSWAVCSHCTVPCFHSCAVGTELRLVSDENENVLYTICIIS